MSITTIIVIIISLIILFKIYGAYNRYLIKNIDIYLNTDEYLKQLELSIFKFCVTYMQDDKIDKIKLSRICIVLALQGIENLCNILFRRSNILSPNKRILNNIYKDLDRVEQFYTTYVVVINMLRKDHHIENCNFTVLSKEAFATQMKTILTEKNFYI